MLGAVATGAFVDGAAVIAAASGAVSGVFVVFPGASPTFVAVVLNFVLVEHEVNVTAMTAKLAKRR